MHTYFQGNLKQIFAVRTHTFPSHFHTNIELIYCFSGSLRTRIGETVYTLNSGDAAVILPNTIHEHLGAADNSDCSPVALICDINLLIHSIPDIITKRVDNPIVKAKDVDKKTVLAFEHMAKTSNETELIGWTFIALSDLLNKIELSPQKSAMDLPSKIILYINTNFKEPLTIKHIAAKFGYNPSYIAHIFCDQLKIPFRTYLGSVRSEYAATQIKTTKKSLAEIAYDSGYKSVNTFCDCFKKHFFKTPSEYRKECK